MPQRIVIVGSGFAGLWAALSARRLISSNAEKATADIEVSVIAPDANLVVRPRLYETNPAAMSTSVEELYRVCGVRFVYGIVDTIRTADHEIEMVDRAGVRSTVPYEKLILAAGSRVVQPAIPGISDFAFSVDQLEDAVKLERHLHNLASKPPSIARNTVVVCGGGFTGIELATELPGRLRGILGEEANVRVIVVDRRQDIGPELGTAPRPHIAKALEDVKAETRLGPSVVSIDAEGVTLSSGERIEALTAVWTAGLAATPLTKQVSDKRDAVGRLYVDKDLRVPSAKDVFATGDASLAEADDKGHYAKMSCQHAIPLGIFAGNNAAAELLGIATVPYSQPAYQCCLDLGGAGAIVYKGWEATVGYRGDEAKNMKRFINSTLIYPPKAIASVAFTVADPAFDGSDFTVDHPSFLKYYQENGLSF
ncbi:FAD-containing subunit of NADH dehydrogenase [Xylaria sp. FL1777]|nr:FAD-containing subunit of NADH dehydrogenase [Xylaria sp. FL1777]